MKDSIRELLDSQQRQLGKLDLINQLLNDKSLNLTNDQVKSLQARFEQINKSLNTDFDILDNMLLGEDNDK